MKRLRFILAAPIASVLLLCGVAMETSMLVKPADAEPFHLVARTSIESVPRQIGSWVSEEVEVPHEAIQLLRPNALVSRHYVDPVTNRWADLLIDQCKDANDMLGHYPPRCYVGSGEDMDESQTRNRDWLVGDLTIIGVEYHFVRTTSVQSSRRVVYNFMIVPGKGIVRDMEGVTRAARDYRRRNFGAAQFQLVMGDDVPVSERDRIFAALMQPCVPTIKTLMMQDEPPAGELKR